MAKKKKLKLKICREETVEMGKETGLGAGVQHPSLT